MTIIRSVDVLAQTEIRQLQVSLRKLTLGVIVFGCLIVLVLFSLLMLHLRPTTEHQQQRRQRKLELTTIH